MQGSEAGEHLVGWEREEAPLKTPHAFVVFPVWAESSRKVRTSVSVVHGRISSLWKGAWYAAGALCLLSE